jgi:hypothetical protein
MRLRSDELVHFADAEEAPAHSETGDLSVPLDQLWVKAGMRFQETGELL